MPPAIASTIGNPTPEERKTAIEALKWWWFDVNDYDPHSGQMPLHLSDARYRILIAGTRGGKSRAAGEEIPLYLFAGATRVWIVGQTYALTEKEFRYVKDRMTSPQAYALFHGNSPIDKLHYNARGGDMYLRTKWGAEVFCISLEKAEVGAMGEEVDLIVLSETALMKRPKSVYQRILRGRLASRIGDLIIPTTPAGKTNPHDKDGWLFDMFQKGLDVDQPNYFSFQFPSWTNPSFRDDPYEIRSEMDPKIFAEQYEGKFMVISGAVFSRFNPKLHVLKPFKMPKHWYRVEGIDPGFSGKFVWLGGGISETGSIFITDEYSDEKTDFETRAKVIQSIRGEHYGVPGDLANYAIRKNNSLVRTYVDSADPQAILELSKLGVPGIPANKKDILVSVSRVQRRLRYAAAAPPTIYVTSNCTETIEALQFHSWGDKTTQDIRRPANDKWKHWGDVIRYICAGNLVATPPLMLQQPTSDGDLYEFLMAEMGARGKHPHEMTREERRVA